VGFVLVGLQGCASGPPPTATELGEQALVEGDWRGALVHFALALREQPSDGRAWLGQAQAHLAGRDAEAALQSLGRLAKIDPERMAGQGRETVTDVLAAVTRVRLKRSQSQAALVTARELSRMDPNRADVRRLLGDALFAEGDRLRLRGDPKSAYRLFAEATQVDPSQLSAWIGSAELLIEARDSKGAVRVLEAARRHHPTSGEIRTLTIQALRSR
jgi:tetratricopeptide (TPR) repeat protein